MRMSILARFIPVISVWVPLFCFGQDSRDRTVRVSSQDLPSPQSPVNIGSTELRLGMQKQDVLSKLANQYQLTKAKLGDDSVVETWWVGTTKDEPLGFANVAFTQDKLSFVSKELGAFSGTEPARALGSFFRELQALHAPGHDGVFMFVGTHEITTTTTQSRPDDTELRIRSIYLDTGWGKRLEISIFETIGSDAPPTIQVNELLNDPGQQNSQMKRRAPTK